MRVRAFLLLAVLALAALAGCFGPKSSPVDVLLANPLLVAQPGRGGDLVVVAASTLAFKQTLPVHAEGLPQNWSLEPEKTSLDLPGQKRVAFIVHVAPGNNTTYGLHSFDLMIGDSRVTARVFLDALPAASAAPVATWFAANGTILATSDPTARDAPDIEHAGGFDLTGPPAQESPCDACGISASAAARQQLVGGPADARAGESHAQRASDGTIKLYRAVG